MRISTVTAVIAALVAAVSATAASPINGTDRANAARACTSLRAAGASTFALQYRTFGACSPILGSSLPGRGTSVGPDPLLRN